MRFPKQRADDHVPAPAQLDMQTVEALLPLVWHWLLAFGVGLARPFALLSVSPLFTRMQLSGLLRGAAASALALPVLPWIAGQLGHAPIAPITLMLILAKEALLGGVIGFALGIPFWALGFAGDVVDNHRGANQGRLATDPASGDDLSVTGTLLTMTGMTLFVLTGGLQVIVQALYTSWAVWAPLRTLPLPSPGTPTLVLALLDTLARTGLRLAAPILIAMILADVTLIIVGRFTPQLRVEDMAMVARNLVFTLFLPLYCTYLIVYMRQDQAVLPHIIEALQPVLAHPGPAAVP